MTRALLSLGALTASVGLALASLARARPATVDDAFIVLVYARHLLGSGRLYWNLGEGPLDGFTSPLDLLVRTVGLGVGGTDPVLTSWWTCLGYLVLACLAAVWLCARVARGPDPGATPRRWTLLCALLGALVIAGSRCVAVGTAFLLETPLFLALALALVGVLLAQPRSRPGLLLLAGLLIAVPAARPEGLALASLGAVFHVVTRRRELPRARLLAAPLALAGAVALWGAWHLAVFGCLAPNTYYAKRSASLLWELRDGLQYVWAHEREPILGLQLLCALLAPLPLWRRLGLPAAARRGCALVGLGAVASLAVVVWGGGDGYPGGRFLAVPAALGTVALVLAAAQLPHPRRLVPAALLVLLAAGQLWDTGMDLATGRATEAAFWPLRERHFAPHREVAERLAAIFPGGTVAQSDYQRVKYFADGLRVVDLHGLNDRRIAHERVDGQVVFGKFRHQHGIDAAAEVWIYGHKSLFNRVPLAGFSMQRVMHDPAVYEPLVGYGVRRQQAAAMRAMYLPASLPSGGQFFNFLVRRDVAARAAAAGVLVGETGSEAGSPAN
jgi:hypothetical protein